MSIDFAEYISKDSLSLAGNVASIISLVVSLFVLKQVSAIRKKSLLMARYPKLIDDLMQISLDLNTKLSDFDREKVDIYSLLWKIKSILISLKGKISGEPKKNTNDLLDEFKETYFYYLLYKYKTSFSYDDTWRIFTKLQGLITLLDNCRQDMPWE